MTQFGEMLRRERKETNLLLGDVAERMRISVPYLSQIENGRRPPTDTFVERVILVLGLSATQGNELRRAAAQAATEFSLKVGSNAPAEDRVLASRLAYGFARLSPEKKQRLRELIEEHD